MDRKNDMAIVKEIVNEHPDVRVDCTFHHEYVRGNESSTATNLCLQCGKLESIPSQIGLLTGLIVLDLRNNRIERIEHVENLKLSSLLLAGNHISKLDGIPFVRDRLDLGYNRVSDIKPIGSLHHLKEIDLSGNNISSMVGIGNVLSRHLEYLSLASNGISRIEGIDDLVNLKILDVRMNAISKIEGIEHLTSLEEIDASDNRIDSIDVDSLSRLKFISLRGNPVPDWQLETLESRGVDIIA